MIPIAMKTARLPALLLWLCLVTPPSSAAPKFEDSMAQRTLACTACHGAEGRAAPDGYYPRIAGKPTGYLYNQLVNFRDGRRHYGLMTRLLEPLSDAYLAEIAGHFAALDLPYPAPARVTAPAAVLERGRLLALQGDPSQQLPACVACHGARLTGVQPGTPGLLGLPRDYLNAQLGAWRSGQRRAHSPIAWPRWPARSHPRTWALWPAGWRRSRCQQTRIRRPDCQSRPPCSAAARCCRQEA